MFKMSVYKMMKLLKFELEFSMFTGEYIFFISPLFEKINAWFLF